MTIRTHRIAQAFTAISLALILAAPALASAQTRRSHWAPRLRAGISGVGGGFVGEVHGGLGGVSPRIGLQVNDWLAILVQGQGLVGRFVPGPDHGVAGFAFHEVMVELTAADTFQLAAGPSLDFVWGCSSTQPGEAYCARGGAFAGANFRAALVFGGRHDLGPRTGFTVSFDAHPTLLDDGRWSTVLLLGFGVDLY